VLLRTVNQKIPADVERLVAGLLMKDRERRHSAAEVARELKRLSSKEAEPAVAMQRRRFVAVAVLALLVILGASGAFFYRSSKRQWARYEAIPQIYALAIREITGGRLPPGTEGSQLHSGRTSAPLPLA
jgi:hypothetical protein